MNNESALRKLFVSLWYRTLYRPVMRLAHRFHWHHAPPCYPDGDTLLRCAWCGLTYVVARRKGDVAVLFKTTSTRSTGRNPGDGQP